MLNHTVPHRTVQPCTASHELYRTVLPCTAPHPYRRGMGSYLSVLRAFRLMRVLRLARSWKSLNRIIKIALASFAAVSWLTLLLLLAMFIWGLLGMQFFGFTLARCQLEGAKQLCPPGLDVLADCPQVWDCYIRCDPGQEGGWFELDGSPYGNRAYCERFPRDGNGSTVSSTADSTVGSTPGSVDGTLGSTLSGGTVAVGNGTGATPGLLQVEYWAQVGKADVPRANYDTMFHAFVTVFQVIDYAGFGVGRPGAAAQPSNHEACVVCASCDQVGGSRCCTGGAGEGMGLGC